MRNVLGHKVGGKLLHRWVKPARHSMFGTAMELEIWEISRVHKAQDKYRVMWYADLGLEQAEWKVLQNPTYKYMKDAKKFANGVRENGDWVKNV